MRRIGLVLICVASVLVPARAVCATTESSDERQRVIMSPVRLQTAIDLGSGIKPDADAVAGDCVDVDAKDLSKNKKLGAATQSLEYHRVTTHADVARVFGVDAGGSMGLGFFSGSAEASFSEDRAVSSFEDTILVRVQVTGEPIALHQPKLRPEYQKLAKTNPDEFYKRCGRGFVYAVTRGGQMFGRVRIRTDSESVINSVRATVDAQGFGWEAFGKVTSALAGFNNRASISIELFQAGGEKSLPTVGDLYESARKFMDQLGSAHVPVSFDVRPYSYVDGWPEPKLSVLPDAEVLRQLKNKYDKLVDELANRRYVVANPSQFKFPAGTSCVAGSGSCVYQDEVKSIRATLDKIVDLYGKCASDGKCKFSDVPEITLSSMPVHKIDACDSVGCGHGTCEVVGAAATCKCAPGYCGASCDTPAFRCEEAACATSTNREEEALCRLYYRLLDRPLDPAGRTGWGNLLQTAPMRDVVSRVASSTEFREKCHYNIGECVERLYARLLGRCSDPVGRSNWQKRLSTGVFDERWPEVVNGFVSSAEYLNSNGNAGLPEPWLAPCP